MKISYAQVYQRGFKAGKANPQRSAGDLHAEMRHSQGHGSSSTKYNQELRRGLNDGIQSARGIL